MPTSHAHLHPFSFKEFSMPDNGGFLVSPAKSPGPQPIIVRNLSHHAQAYSLAPVATRMQGKWCAPTSKPVPWFHVASTVTIGPRKSVSLPVRVQGQHGVTDVAVKVQPQVHGTHAAVAYAAYGQEIIGKGSASGCAIIRGQHAAAAPAPSGGSAPWGPIGFAVVTIALLVACYYLGRAVRHRKYRGAHR